MNLTPSIILLNFLGIMPSTAIAQGVAEGILTSALIIFLFFLLWKVIRALAILFIVKVFYKEEITEEDGE